MGIWDAKILNLNIGRNASWAGMSPVSYRRSNTIYVIQVYITKKGVAESIKGLCLKSIPPQRSF
jgi:hypothetical protein